MREVRFGFYFVGGSVALVVIAALMAQLVLWRVGRQPVQNLILRQAIKGLFRKGGATRAIMITLTAALSVIFANYLIESFREKV